MFPAYSNIISGHCHDSRINRVANLRKYMLVDNPNSHVQPSGVFGILGFSPFMFCLRSVSRFFGFFVQVMPFGVDLLCLRMGRLMPFGVLYNESESDWVFLSSQSWKVQSQIRNGYVRYHAAGDATNSMSAMSRELISGDPANLAAAATWELSWQRSSWLEGFCIFLTFSQWNLRAFVSKQLWK